MQPIRILVYLLLCITTLQTTPPPPPPLTPEEGATLQAAWDEAASASEPMAPAHTAPADAAPPAASPPAITSDPSPATPSVRMGSTTRREVSLVVPAIPRDVGLFETHLLVALSQQTLQPSEVIVALSDTNATVARELEARWGKIFEGLVVLDHPGSQMPGENRNRGAALATSPIISFMDADDRMHPQRLEIIADVLTSSDAMVIIHSFSVAKGDSLEAPGFASRWAPDDWRRMVEQNVDGAVSTGQQLTRRWERFMGEAQEGRGYWPLEAHGHLTVSRRVMDDVAFNAELRNEDTDFIKRVSQHDGKVVFVPLPLSEYAPSGADGFFQNAINLWGDMQDNVFSKYGVVASR